jgi:hypothetical protein
MHKLQHASHIEFLHAFIGYHIHIYARLNVNTWIILEENNENTNVHDCSYKIGLLTLAGRAW